MLFNSFEFIFLFLPITLAVFFWLSKSSKYVEQQLPIIWLVLASFFFYGWWQLHSINLHSINLHGIYSRSIDLILIVASILINYGLGYCLSNVVENPRFKKSILILGIVLNLGLISYFKYANFVVSNFNQIFHTKIHLPPIALPLAISFFTFIQIAYLIDAYKGKTRDYTL
ncbi:MAG: MBOAT family protein, partial [Waterburya sp.]